MKDFLVEYLRRKREDDLRITARLPRSREEIPMPDYRAEAKAVLIAIAYLRGWRPDVRQEDYLDLLRKAGHRPSAIDSALGI